VQPTDLIRDLMDWRVRGGEIESENVSLLRLFTEVASSASCSKR